MRKQEEIEAIKAKIVKAELDSRTWQIDGDEEKYLDAYDRGEAFESLLERKLKQTYQATYSGPDSRSYPMLKSLSHISGSTIEAEDGAVGHVKTVFFDDQLWGIRYLVVETGTWLSRREVLISPYAVKRPLGEVKQLNVLLTRQQIKDSPDIDTHEPVSRQHEREYLKYFSYPEYWGGADLWGTGIYPVLPAYTPTAEEIDADRVMRQREFESADIHLRSAEKVTGYAIQATDKSIGHIKDFIFDEETWAIRYLVIDTRKWWPGGWSVLVATSWITSIDWASNTAFVKLTSEQIKNSPEYEDWLPIDRNYEKLLHDAYNLQGYWP